MRSLGKKLWGSRHLGLAIVWILLAIPTVLFWKEALVWVMLMSIYANVESSLAAHNAQQDNERQHCCCCRDDTKETP